MKSLHRTLTLAALVAVLCLSTTLSAASKGKGLNGNWEVMLDVGNWQMPSILSLRVNEQGEYRGEWVSLFGISVLKDIKREGRDLSFGLVTQIGDEATESRFEGSLKQGQLSGQISSDGGEISAEGKRLKYMPGLVGTWNLTYTVDDREIKAVLLVSKNEQNELQAECQSEDGEHVISNVQIKKNTLTFSSVTNIYGSRYESTFEGALKGRVLNGMIKSEGEEIAAVGKKAGVALIGKWDLTMTSDRGTRKQRLVVHPDLSATFAGCQIAKVHLEQG